MNSQNSLFWIDEDVVRAIHETQIAEHGGSLGVRDPGLLASALVRPRTVAGYSSPDVAALAALYACGVIKNHPFVDGNKRVGAVLLELFLNVNGYDLTVENEQMLPIIMSVASGKMPLDDLTDWVRENSVRREPY